MSQLLFNRAASIVLSADNRPDRVIAPAPQYTNGPKIPGQVRISFQVEKTNQDSASKKAPPSAKITLYNLARSSLAYLKDPATQNSKVRLECGYYGRFETPQLKTVFVGDIIRATTTKNGGDLITEIEANDSLRALNTKNINESFAPGTSAQTVIGKMTEALGVGIGEVAENFLGQFVNGFSASGLIRDQLTVITDKADSTWSIQNGNLEIVPKNEANRKTIYSLSPQSGLIGVPNQKDDGIEFKSLLIPELAPNRRVEIASRQVNGVFRITRIKYNGDTRQGPWHCECEAV